MKRKLKTFKQINAYTSPWSLQRRIGILLWEYCWPISCGWTPKPLNFWRLFVLKIFGAEIYGRPFVHGRARIDQPWNLTLHDRSCLGDRSHAYCLDKITLQERSTVAQEAYLCTGTHDFTDPHIPLQTAPIVVGEDVFVGARAFIMPGVKLGKRSIVGANSVVTKDVDIETVVFGNPARVSRKR